METMPADGVEEIPDEITELTFVGEFGFNKFQGRLDVQKAEGVWEVEIPTDTFRHPPSSSLVNEAAVLLVDGTVVGGGIVDDVYVPADEPRRLVRIDQYAIGDPL